MLRVLISMSAWTCKGYCRCCCCCGGHYWCLQRYHRPLALVRRRSGRGCSASRCPDLARHGRVRQLRGHARQSLPAGGHRWFHLQCDLGWSLHPLDRPGHGRSGFRSTAWKQGLYGTRQCLVAAWLPCCGAILRWGCWFFKRSVSFFFGFEKKNGVKKRAPLLGRNFLKI